MDSLITERYENVLLRFASFGVLPGGLALAGLYFVGLAIYRLFLSPISHIPGPKLAAVTYLFGHYVRAI